MPSPPPSASRPGPGSRWWGIPAGLTLFLGVVLSFLAYWRLTTETHQRLQASLESADDSRVFALSNAIRSYSDFLAGFQLLFTHSDDVTLEEFEGAALAALSDYPGLSGLEWAKFITQDELPDLRAELGAMGLPPP
jgi:CHASE1-domain containing sensor protein